ncbi:Spermidine/putrescine import ATP-binding protein PotA [Pseudodesulfovibrio profundus]|uniref:Spermidine/putrescine import ATP-binding protein PotA n=1 Tax=Pseudodesulfovibrio profundus TaxID=57320 RepID=A0A2C8F624_9BACT|nr:ABC transporter ATP-binding protein [Pseudodesulfovibrio profundus]SOB57878.1 Spermidine/putrescine import ATP-binding protein PotA [Pseudodesulfovibrio profundus]
MTKSLLEVRNINKFYDELHVVRNVTFSLNEGDIGCLLGPSGCGKTTLLRTIAGFEDIAGGSIVIDGQIVSGPSSVAPENRNIGMVFQDYALFPHLSVADNVSFGLLGASSEVKKQRVVELLETVGLASEQDKFPHELSGGQQQRVALARALAPEPKLLLMDEPFSNLDVALRETLSSEIREILKARSITALMVTHNQNEAFAMADKVGVLSCGEMQQWDTPNAVYHHPSNTLVAGFVGEGAFITGKVTGDGTLECALGVLEGVFSSHCGVGCEVSLLIRPEDIVHDDNSPHEATIMAKTFRGATILYTLRLDSGEEVQALVPSHHQHAIGQQIGICQDVEDLVVFPAGSNFEPAEQCGI